LLRICIEFLVEYLSAVHTVARVLLIFNRYIEGRQCLRIHYSKMNNKEYMKSQ
jgi:hypothetical protein